MDNKAYLVDYFIKEIKRVSEKEEAIIDDEIAKDQGKLKQEMQEEVAFIVKQKEEALKQVMQFEHRKRMADLKEKMTRMYMDERDELVNTLFEEVKNKLITFSISSEYDDYIEKKLIALKEYDFKDGCLSLSNKDLNHAIAWQKLCNANKVIIDDNIVIGGFKLVSEAKGMVVDESIDASFEEAKAWFYENSGFLIA